MAVVYGLVAGLGYYYFGDAASTLVTNDLTNNSPYTGRWVRPQLLTGHGCPASVHAGHQRPDQQLALHRPLGVLSGPGRSWVRCKWGLAPSCTTGGMCGPAAGLDADVSSALALICSLWRCARSCWCPA